MIVGSSDSSEHGGKHVLVAVLFRSVLAIPRLGGAGERHLL